MKNTDFTEENDLSTSNIIKEYAPLVKKIALHLAVRLPGIIQAEDLIQAGMIGLIEASGNFDHTKGASFATFAGIRIKGAMLDEMRRLDWTPRSVHRNSRRVAKAVSQVENEKGRDARDLEVATAMGVTLEEYHQFLQDTANVKMHALDDLPHYDDYVDYALIRSILSPLDYLQKDNINEKLQFEIAKLPDKEKQVLRLYYEQDMNLREVGQMLGVSESRISQIHTQAVGRLKNRLVGW